MIRSVFEKVAWLGRTASMVFGLALVLALVFGAATTAFGANGNNLVLGSLNNAATAMTKLTGNVPGGPALLVQNTNTQAGSRALQLAVAPGKAPLMVNATAGKAWNLNADKIDGKSSEQFADGAGGVANNADKLDGKDSSEFLGKTDKAADSDALDGLNSTDLARTVHGTSEATYGTPTNGHRQHLLTLPTGDRIDWGCDRFGNNYYVNNVALSAGSGGSRRTVVVQELPNLTTVHENYGGVFGGLGNNDGTRSVDTFTLRTTTMNSPSPFVATVEVVVNYRQDTCHISAQGTVSGGV